MLNFSNLEGTTVFQINRNMTSLTRETFSSLFNLSMFVAAIVLIIFCNISQADVSCDQSKHFWIEPKAKVHSRDGYCPG